KYYAKRGYPQPLDRKNAFKQPENNRSGTKYRAVGRSQPDRARSGSHCQWRIHAGNNPLYFGSQREFLKKISAMKQVSYTILLLAILCGASSCQKYLEMNPDNRVRLSTVEDYRAVITGAYPQAYHMFTE